MQFRLDRGYRQCTTLGFPVHFVELLLEGALGDNPCRYNFYAPYFLNPVLQCGSNILPHSSQLEDSFACQAESIQGWFADKVHPTNLPEQSPAFLLLHYFSVLYVCKQNVQFSSQISFPTNLKLTTHLFSFCDLNIHKVFNHQMSIFVNKDCPLDHKTFSILCLVKYTCWIGCIIAIGYCSSAI